MKKQIPLLLEHWGMTPHHIEAMTVRENRVYRIDTHRGRFALKIARPFYHGRAEMESEIAFLRHLEAEGFATPQPVPTTQGDYLIEDASGDLASLQEWVEGKPFGRAGGEIEEDEKQFHRLGKKIARLHRLGKDWQRPDYFSRPDWGKQGLVGDNPFWGRFWENPVLSAKDKKDLESFRDHARLALPPDENLLIHADLVPDNIIIEADNLVFIDFDDFGSGYALFDLATILLKIDHNSRFERAKAALLEGYVSERSVDFHLLDFFIALRSCSYLGWIISRPELDPDTSRSARYRDHAFRKIRILEAAI